MCGKYPHGWTFFHHSFLFEPLGSRLGQGDGGINEQRTWPEQSMYCLPLDWGLADGHMPVPVGFALLTGYPDIHNT